MFFLLSRSRSDTCPLVIARTEALWHIPFALNGQTYSAVSKTLRFEPNLPCPYVLPMLVPGAVGTLACNGGTSFTLAVTLGELDLALVTIAGTKGPVSKSGVHLQAGQSIKLG